MDYYFGFGTDYDLPKDIYGLLLAHENFDKKFANIVEFDSHLNPELDCGATLGSYLITIHYSKLNEDISRFQAKELLNNGDLEKILIEDNNLSKFPNRGGDLIGKSITVYTNNLLDNEFIMASISFDKK